MSGPGIRTRTIACADAVFTFSEAGSGAPVLLVHGALADQRMWAHHQALLAASGYRALALTLRHFGGQADPAQAPFGVETHARDLAAFIAALQLGPVHVVAWSYGAHVALWAALQQPTLVRSLFLYEPGFPTWVTDEEALRAFGADAQAMFGPVFAAAGAGDIPGAVRALMDGSGNRPGYFDAQPPERRALQVENGYTLPLMLQQAPAPVITCADLASLRTPACVARGALSRPVFSVVGEAAQRCAPGPHLVVPGAAHMWPDEDPAAFCEAVADFLQRVR